LRRPPTGFDSSFCLGQEDFRAPTLPEFIVPDADLIAPTEQVKMERNWVKNGVNQRTVYTSTGVV
jgi:hypothetical protein